MKRTFLLLLLFLFGIGRGSNVHHKDGGDRVTNTEDIVLVSTLDGRLQALDVLTGKQRWQMQEAAVLRAPNSITRGFTFLPNPQDGSLYSLRNGALERLPFTIPQVVAASPTRGNDGVFYAGSKKDTWLGIDPTTGEKVETLSTAASTRMCPANHPNLVYIGRREYRLTMYDPENVTRSWNTTFYDYSAYLQPADSKYPYRHLVSTSTGDVLAIHKDSGSLLWQADVGQPIVAMYLLRSNGLHRLEYTPVGRETMESIVEKSFADASIWAEVLSLAVSPSAKTGFFPALYVGATSNGLFAANAFVDDKTFTLAPKYLGPRLLLEGPTPIGSADGGTIPPRRPIVTIDSDTITHKTDDGEFLILGYHEPPRINLGAVIPNHAMPQPFAQAMHPYPHIEYVIGTKDDDKKIIGTDPLPQLTDSTGDGEHDTLVKLFWLLKEQHPYALYSSAVTILILIISTIFMCGRQAGVAAGEARSQQTSRVSTTMDGREESGSGNVGWKRGRQPVTGWIQVGKVHYDTSDILGTGCQGTVVYRGKFDGREVAVKRVLTEFLPLVDREVELLRESDSHAHVIRYFCMESDSQFRYLALELCVASLYDYVERKREEVRQFVEMEPCEILRQATDGLAHLHSINIVHRDLKPQNVLISNTGGRKTRALISDFGLCKRLHPGRHSLSKRSGVAGTDGWIAPEALKAQSTSFPMDVFSLGCIFYYVLSDGRHPFGESLHRTSNILNGMYTLSAVSEGECDRRSTHLIDQMLRPVPHRRPTASATLTHPFFWDKGRQLQFFSDVSDRVEKEMDMSPILRRLEKNGFAVVKKNWREKICEALQEDLRKFRTYKGHSVRDLLRAMRNKKHHYRELPDVVRSSLGEVPHDFVHYFTSRFPELLMHVYDAMEWCAEEAVFMGYYSNEVRDRIGEVRAETEKRMAEESSDSEVWLRGRVSTSSNQDSPQQERKKLELLPRSRPITTTPDTSATQATPPSEEEETPPTLVPPSELKSAESTASMVTVDLDIGPPPGLEGMAPIPPDVSDPFQKTERTKKKKRR